MKETSLSDMNYKLLPTKQQGMSTIQVTIGNNNYLLYSKYNPIKDSRAFAERCYDYSTENYLVYGLGLGYHINELENLIITKGRNYHIYVVECNSEILKLAKNSVNLSRILNNKNITFLMMNNNKSYKELNKILSIDNIKIGIHRPSLNIIPEKFIEFRHLLEEFMMKQDNINTYSDILHHNFNYNIKNFNENVDVLFNKYTNKPLYLVAAGPSLDKNIHELSKVKGNGVILSVGRAVRPLLLAGVIPDYIIITDPSDTLYDKQLKTLDVDVPIIVLSTCDKNVMKNYSGKKYIALQKGYPPAEEYAKINNNILVETGGSVATTGLDIAIRMRCNPIIFVGQDLAFTNQKTHSKDTFSQNIIDSHSLRNIEDIYGNYIKTSKNLNIYLRWIQNRIAKEKNINFIDATEGGAKINGTFILKLKDTINKFV